MDTILVTGALGQIGSELVPALRGRYGAEKVVATDIRLVPADSAGTTGPCEYMDCTHEGQIREVVRKYRTRTIFHLAALLSAVAEERPQAAWSVNMGGLYRVLEIAREHRCAVFFPSSIAAFGPTTPPRHAPQETLQRPTTIYGVAKVAGELLCDYYHRRFGVDTRGVRYPGLVSHGAPPGGGTTDYAVEIFHHALEHHRYTCFLQPDTALDMMYMPDAIRAAVQLMEADQARLRHRNAFNLSAMTFTPAQLAAQIRRHIPDFTIDYRVDPVRQAIADSWPSALDDGAARREWGWSPEYDLETMTRDMLARLADRTIPAVSA